jgi:hypothetical protein
MMGIDRVDELGFGQYIAIDSFHDGHAASAGYNCPTSGDDAVANLIFLEAVAAWLLRVRD